MNYLTEDDMQYLMHRGTPQNRDNDPHGSGRYRQGTGKNPYQHDVGIYGRVHGMRKDGYSDKAIAESLGLSIREMRAQYQKQEGEYKRQQANAIFNLYDNGTTNKSEIARQLHCSEGTVRNVLSQGREGREKKVSLTKITAERLKETMQERDCYLDISRGVEIQAGVSKDRLEKAALSLKDEGYDVLTIHVPQVGSHDKYTTMNVLVPAGTTVKDVNRNLDKVKDLENYQVEEGSNAFGTRKPVSIDSSRIFVKYNEEGGVDKDGVIEIRKGVDDLSLGASHYAQVRVAVDDSYYIKGMAMYSNDIPPGYDILINSNKHVGTPLKGEGDYSVLKQMKTDPDNPFGATIKIGGQSFYEDPNGSFVKVGDNYLKAKKGDEGERYSQSAINKVNEEGDWDTWSRTLSSQFLSKQPKELIKKQLDLAYADKKAEYDEIMSLTNPVIKQKLLKDFAETCDAAAVDLKAAALPGMQQHVILPLNSLKDNEIYAPNYPDGSKVVLIRYPHSGPFEIPELVVNNRNKAGKELLGNAKDAVGITIKTAEKLSGADFDGDSVMVIPLSDKVKIKTADTLPGLVGFNSQDDKYQYVDGMKVLHKGKETQMQMGTVSNLITDMQLKGAPNEHIERAVRHSMVIIDAAKHKLNYKLSEELENIKELKTIYQGGPNAGASTLISRARKEVRVDERKANWKYDEDGKITYRETNGTHTDWKKDPKTGEWIDRGEVKNKTKVKMLANTDDAYTLVSDRRTIPELLYADYSNKLKALANQSRVDYTNTKAPRANSSAAKTYSDEVQSLKDKLNNAKANAPRERQAQLLANQIIRAKVKDNPGLRDDKDQMKKENQRAIRAARGRVGANKKDVMIDITDSEWNAIQAGAVSPTMLKDIFNNTDGEKLKKRATPRADSNKLSDAKIQLIKSMDNSDFTIAQIAERLGVSTSTVKNYL